MLATLTVSTAVAAPRTLGIANDGRSYAGFKIDDTIDTVDGTTKKVTGTVTLDSGKLAASAVTLSVDLASLDTGIGLRDSEMRDTLETKKFPQAVFRSTAVIGPASLDTSRPADVKLAGDFTLHGVTRRINVPVRLTLDAAGRLQASGRFVIRMTDYDLTVPDKLIVSVANEVAVRFDVTAK
jgi:polyisoprenoid-binding protein YceI